MEENTNATEESAGGEVLVVASKIKNYIRGQSQMTTSAAVMSVLSNKVRQLCDKAADGEMLVPANFNCPGQIVLSGTKSACQRAEKLAAEFGAIKAVMLRVAGAFHSDMMSPAAQTLSQVLAQTNISLPKTKVIANISASYYESPQQIRDGLTKQLTQPILWQSCMEKLLADGVETFYEFGPGRVLTGLMRKINRKTNINNISGFDVFSLGVK